VLVVAMAGVLVFVLVALSAAGGLVTAQRRAQSAADLAALAGATASSDHSDDACAEAARTAAANAAVVDECRSEGPEVTVVVSVAGPSVPWQEVRVSAEARAGPG